MMEPQNNFDMLQKAVEPIERGDYLQWWWALIGIISVKHDITGVTALAVLYDEDPDVLSEYYVQDLTPIQAYDFMFGS